MIDKATIVGLIVSVFAQIHPVKADTPHYVSEVSTINIQVSEEIKPLETVKPMEEIAPIGPSVQGPGNPNNTYVWGNCTWYVANNKSIPNNWGNAATWLPRAESQGFQTGSEPVVGAVVWFPPGYTLGHVAIVEEVYGNGTIRISEMNAPVLGAVSYRIIPKYSARYIY